MPKRLAASLRDQRAATLRQLDALDDDAWAELCLPPWRVRDVIAHLVSLDEAIVTGRILPVLRRDSPSDFERWNDAAVLRLAGLEIEELRERLARWGGRVCTLARGLPPVLDRMSLRTAFGRLSPRALLRLRVADEWVHTVDIAGVTGVPAEWPAAAGDALASGVLATFPARVLPHVTQPVGILHLEVGVGDRGNREGATLHWGVDFARRQYGSRVLRDADATVHLHASTLALLAYGRLSWREAQPGSLVIEGDEGTAGGLLDAIGR